MIQVLLGNAKPKTPSGQLRDEVESEDVTHGGAPCVTYVNLPDGDGGYDFDALTSIDIEAVKAHMVNAILRRGGITQLPGLEPLLDVTHPSGLWPLHSGDPTPTWVSVPDHPVLEAGIAAIWDIPAGAPADIEDTHFTEAGAPGTHPNPAADVPVPDVQMNITQTGRDMAARNMGGGILGGSGAGTAAGTTSFTSNFTTSSTTQFNGQRISVYSTSGTIQVWGLITACTNGANAQFTVDRWYNAATPGGAAGTTPSTPFGFIILDGGPAAWFVGLSADTVVPGTPSTATALTSEIVTGGGGLIRSITTFAHTASQNTWTLTHTWTTNGSDVLPVTVAKIGVFSSFVVGTLPSMLFETLLNTTATLSAIGDQLTCTETVTTS